MSLSARPAFFARCGAGCVELALDTPRPVAKQRGCRTFFNEAGGG